MRTQKIYEPNKQFKLGLRVWQDMFGEIYEYRELIWRLFVRDFSAKYKQSLLGNFWNLFMPFVAIGTFVFLKKAGIVNISPTDMPYPLYALLGLSFWQIFASGLNAGANSLVGAGDLITKINFPREVLVMASMAQAVFEFAIKFFLIVCFFAYYHFIPSWTIIFLPVVLLPLGLLTLGLALGISILNGVMRDVGNIVSLLIMFLMFLTPVLYPIKNDHFIFFQLNILAVLVDAPRELIASGHISHLGSYLMASVVSLLIFLISWRVFHLAETKIPERV